MHLCVVVEVSDVFGKMYAAARDVFGKMYASAVAYWVC
jgi:hypothetical protein